MRITKQYTVILSLLVLLLFAGCQTEVLPTPTPQPPTPTPTPTPEPKRLTVCMPEEPDSLYVYGTDTLAAHHVWQALYDGPIDRRNYAYQPVIVTQVPSVGNGGARVDAVSVQAGERTLSADGQVVSLSEGVTVENASGEEVVFDGTPVSMPQLVVTFTLQAGVTWSDGEPVTADDSVFSFEVASDGATPGSTGAAKGVIERTASYQAVDPQTVVWRGLPGYKHRAYMLNFWHPLPRHAWGAIPPSELLATDEATRRPLGWGPFRIVEWEAGSHIALERNPFYFRTDQGLPRLDEVVYRFIVDPQTLADELTAGRCDLVTHEAADGVVQALPDVAPVATVTTHDARWELLAFNISPRMDDARPDRFEDVRVRQAIAQCIDRPSIVAQVQGPEGRVLHSYVPPEHYLYAGEGLTTWSHDPQAAQDVLAEAGWWDADGDGVREAHNIPTIAEGTLFDVALLTTEDPFRSEVAQLIQSDLITCGIQSTVDVLPAEELFASGPEGPLFGRRFDLALFSLRATADPLCDLFMSRHLPREGNWQGPNVVGFIDDTYDMACQTAIESIPGTRGFIGGHMEAQEIFSRRLPAVPLFQRLQRTLARPAVAGLMPDPTHPSELWNLEQIDLP